VVFCFDTDVISAAMRPVPPMQLVRRLARTPVEEQCTTAITLGEILYGAARVGRPALVEQLRELVTSAHSVLPFDRMAAEAYGPLRATLERIGKRLDGPDLRIAAIALSRDLTLVTGNVRHFSRVPGLRIENWLESD
jgi:predicted nucleic acid-binding protein